MSTTWTRLDLARRHCLIHLFCSLERLRQWRHIPVPSFSISGRWVNFVQHPLSLPCDVLRSILLRFPLVHQPAIIGSSRQPATGRMSQFRPSHRKLMSLPEVRQRLSMLKDHRSMEIILWSLQRLTFQKFLHPLTSRSVSLEHLLKLFLIELHESSPICLILLIEGLE